VSAVMLFATPTASFAMAGQVEVVAAEGVEADSPARPITQGATLASQSVSNSTRKQRRFA